MLRCVIAFAAVGALLAGLVPARAEVVVTVDKSTQRLSVSVDGVRQHEWPVSTARWGYHTPNGTYRPERLARRWYSRKYNNSPMPYSIFFLGGYAIHGSYEISRIGRPASHGCVRLLPKNAAVLFGIVRANRGNTRIVVTGERPSYRAVARRAREEASARRYRHSTSERRYRQRTYEPRYRQWTSEPRYRQSTSTRRYRQWTSEPRYRQRTSERRYRQSTYSRRYRERIAEQRIRRRYADFEDAFAPARGSDEWDEMLNRRTPSQRALRKWWYSR